MKGRIDREGRLTIPAQFRRTNGITTDTVLNIENFDGKITISSITPKCSICNSESNLITKQNITICQTCKEKIKKEF